MADISAPFIGIDRHRLKHDGEGVTTLAAFHSCPLRCHYCINPQSINSKTACPQYTTQELLDKVMIDNLYFVATGGGITFGGGEPCIRSEFIEQFRSICPESWNINVETSLNVGREHIERLMPIVKEFIIDIKDMNPDTYKNYTGASNDNTLSNLQLLADRQMQGKCTIKLPLINGYNTEDDVDKSEQALRALGFERFNRLTYITNVPEYKRHKRDESRK